MNQFVLEVRGDSMIEDQIADGDYVVIRKQDTARAVRSSSRDGRERSHA